MSRCMRVNEKLMPACRHLFFLYWSESSGIAPSISHNSSMPETSQSRRSSGRCSNVLKCSTSHCHIEVNLRHSLTCLDGVLKKLGCLIDRINLFLQRSIGFR